MIIVFLGPPGAGKGTQSQLLAQKLGLPTISIGHLLREAYQKGTPKGIKAWENYSSRGLNVPLKLKFKILMGKIEENPAGFILDNFPRTAEDLTAFKNYLQKEKKKIDRVFYLAVSEDVAFGRTLDKRVERKDNGLRRKDDRREILKVRIKEGKRDLPLILDYFRHLKVLEEINGEQDVGAIHREILRRLGLDN